MIIRVGFNHRTLNCGFLSHQAGYLFTQIQDIQQEREPGSSTLSDMESARKCLRDSKVCYFQRKRDGKNKNKLNWTEVR